MVSEFILTLIKNVKAVFLHHLSGLKKDRLRSPKRDFKILITRNIKRNK